MHPVIRKRASPGQQLTVSRPELLVDGGDSAFRSLVHGMLAFASRLERIREGFGNLLGLTGIQYTILISIRHLERDGDVTVSSVAEHLHFSGAFITIETGKLARLGLISKVQDLRDRRRVRLRVTRRGQELLSSLRSVQVPVNDALFDFLTSRQFRAVASVIDDGVECGNRALALLDYLAAKSSVQEKRPARNRR